MLLLLDTVFRETTSSYNFFSVIHEIVWLNGILTCDYFLFERIMFSSMLETKLGCTCSKLSKFSKSGNFKSQLDSRHP